jgi:hypothetical protein
MTKISCIITCLLVGFALGGCAETGQEATGEEESVASTSQRLYYESEWEVCSIQNGNESTKECFYQQDAIDHLVAWDLPVDMWDNGSTPSANSGYIYFRLSESGGWIGPVSNNDFNAGFWVTMAQGANRNFYAYKPLNSGNWQTTRGEGGRWGSVGFYAKYGVTR